MTEKQQAPLKIVFKIDIIYFQDFYEEYDKYALASSYFDLKEYDRAVYFLQDCNSSKNYFLHMYGRYLADEKRKVDNASDSIGMHTWNVKFCFMHLI
jgi:hypothetical protein